MSYYTVIIMLIYLLLYYSVTYCPEIFVHTHLCYNTFKELWENFRKYYSQFLLDQEHCHEQCFQIHTLILSFLTRCKQRKLPIIQFSSVCKLVFLLTCFLLPLGVYKLGCKTGQLVWLRFHHWDPTAGQAVWFWLVTIMMTKLRT